MEKTRSITTRKLVMGGVLIALGVVLSPVSIPIGASKVFPAQHMINVIGAVFLGPWINIAMAFVTSFIRVSMGTGSLLAFPGSMIGAALAGLMYQVFGKKILAYGGEVVGTGLFGGIGAYYVASYFMAKQVAVFFFCVPFLLSSLTGTIMGGITIGIIEKLGIKTD